MPKNSTLLVDGEWIAKPRSAAESDVAINRKQWIAGLVLSSAGTIGLGAVVSDRVLRPSDGSWEWLAFEALGCVVLIVAGFACMVVGTHESTEPESATPSIWDDDRPRQSGDAD